MPLADVALLHDELGRVFRRDEDLFLAAGFAPVRAVDLRDEDGDGVVSTRFVYDAQSRLVERVQDDLQSSTRSYDGVHRVVKRTDAAGNSVAIEYDQNSNPVVATETEFATAGLVPAEVFVTRYVYDQFDRMVRVTDNAGQTTRLAYDSRDNLVSRSDPVGLLLADPLGLVPGTINGDGNTETFEYDGLNRATASVRDLRVGGSGAGVLDFGNTDNPDGQIRVEYGYDGNSNLVSRTDDRGATTRYVFDALDRMEELVHADGATTIWIHDADDHVRQVTDANGTISSRSYDALGRVTAVSVIRGPGVVGTTQQSFSYDGLSRLTSATDDNGGAATSTITRVYDSLSRVLEEVQNGRAVSSVYEGDGRRRSCTYPGGRTITCAFDVIDRMVSATDLGGPIWSSTYIGPDYRELTRAMRNGTSLTYLDSGGSIVAGYDAVRRVQRLRWLGPGATQAFVDREMSYNRADIRLLERRHDEDALEDLYVYDSVYRLAQVRFDQNGLVGATPRDLTQRDYRLDGVGSRREVTSSRTSSGVSSELFGVNDVNEYTTVAAVAQVHSNNGNLRDDGQCTFAYDFRNRLVEVADRATGVRLAEYRYDTEGRRTEVLIGPVGAVSARTGFVYDDRVVCEEVDLLAGQSLVTYVYHPVYIDEPVQLERSANHPLGVGEVFLHQNARADVVATTDAAGMLIERARYDDFGIPEVSGPSSGNPYWFQGRRLDSESGLYYFRNRYYDPGRGRFVQRDPLWDPTNSGGWYSFGGNSPVSRRDPLGLQSEEALRARKRLQWEIYDLRQQAESIELYGPRTFWTGELGARAQFEMNDLLVRANALESQLFEDYTYWQRYHDELAKAALGTAATESAKALVGGAIAKGVVKVGGYAWNRVCAALDDVVDDVARGIDDTISGLGDDVGGIMDDAVRATGDDAVRGADSAANRALNERYVDELRAAMERPVVQNPALSNIMDDLYRPGARIGSGSTAAAVRHEAATGSTVGGRLHTQKAQESVTRLQKWLDRNPTARPGDRAAAENVMRDLQNALGGR